MVVEGSRRGGERWAERVCGDTEGDCSQMSGDAVHGVTDWLGNLASVVAGKLDGVTLAASGGHRGADPDSVAATREEEPGVDDEAMGPPGERNEFEQRAFEIKVKQTSNRTRLHWILGRQYPVLGEQLMFMALRDEAKLREVIELRKKEGRDNKVFFTIDDELPYFPFCADFGPLNYGCVCKFTRMLNEKLATCSKQGKRLVLYTRAKLETRTNTATLLGCYLVMAHGYTPEEAWAPFEFENVRPFTTYRDASFDEETYHLTPIDVIQGMYKAKCNNIIDMDAFDAMDADHNAEMHFFDELKAKAAGDTSTGVDRLRQMLLDNRPPPATSLLESEEIRALLVTVRQVCVDKALSDTCLGPSHSQFLPLPEYLYVWFGNRLGQAGVDARAPSESKSRAAADGECARFLFKLQGLQCRHLSERHTSH